ncbi:PAS domain S-box protein [Sinorhizobium meliloti]|uniref:PAS domain S-box protein n=2 Tax=Rhizobium meliloti TaxID=382 RepID=UPI001F160558|nr:PAS domain S-box protein [Sinorhizobium meliloti]
MSSRPPNSASPRATPGSARYSRTLGWRCGSSYGYTADEAVGRPVTLLIPENRLGEESEILSQIRAGRRVDHFETIRRRKDGGLVPVSLRISPIHDDGVVIGASKIARDISERKRAEQQKDLLIREMAHRVKNLFSVSSSVVALSAKNVDTAVELASAVTARLRSLARRMHLPCRRRTVAGQARVSPVCRRCSLLCCRRMRVTRRRDDRA